MSGGLQVLIPLYIDATHKYLGQVLYLQLPVALQRVNSDVNAVVGIAFERLMLREALNKMIYTRQ